MNSSLARYIDTARRHGLSPSVIQANLVEAGWDEAEVSVALKSNDLVPPPPPPAHAHPVTPDKLVKVVPFRSTAGLEYIIYFISLWAASMALAAVLHGVVDLIARRPDSFYEGVNTFASAALVVSFPIFAFLFLRLKRQELADPQIRRDINRKNAVQLTLIVTFIIGLGKTIYYIYELMNLGNVHLGGSGSIGTELAHTIITVGISGLIFAYYWIDDHKKADKS